MPRAPKVTYADRVNFHLLEKEGNNFRPHELVEEIVGRMEANGEVVTRCTRGCVHAYVQGLRIQQLLTRHPSDPNLVQLSEKFQNAIERIRDSGVELDYSNAARLSSLLRVAAGRFKSLTARELRVRVIELLDDINALHAEYNTLKKEHNVLKQDYEDLQVDYVMVQEELDEAQKELHDLKARNAGPEAHNIELPATSGPRHTSPALESSSANTHNLYNASSSPQLGQQQSARGTLSRVPTEIIPPTTPPRASVSRNPSGILTPPTTDARRPLGRRLSRSDSRSDSSSYHSFRENTPGAASVRGATPGSPSLRRHSPPVRQSPQNQNHTPSSPGLAREPSYSEVRTPYRNLMRLAQHHFDEQRATIEHMEEQAVQTHIETIQRQNALEEARRKVQEELAEVCGRLDELEARHRVKTHEYQALLARYTQLRTRVETLTGALKGLTSDAMAAVDEHNAPLAGATTGDVA